MKLTAAAGAVVEHDRPGGAGHRDPDHGQPVGSLRPASPLLLACCAAFIVLPYPLFTYLASGNVPYAVLVLIQIVFAIVISLYSGAGPAAIAEIFPTRSRSTWMTTGYALAVAIFGGFAPFISIWLIDTARLADRTPVLPDRRRDRLDCVVIWSLKETAHRRARLMLIRFDGKTVIVAGAARGIGRAIARAFAADGARRHRLRPAGRARSPAGERVKALPVDVTDEASHRQGRGARPAAGRHARLRRGRRARPGAQAAGGGDARRSSPASSTPTSRARSCSRRPSRPA